MSDAETFGMFVRNKRKEKNIKLKEMAQRLSVSPTYLSLCERSKCKPPNEIRIKAMASELGCDADALLARAGRISNEIAEIIKHHSLNIYALLRATDGMSYEDIQKLIMEASKLKQNVI